MIKQSVKKPFTVLVAVVMVIALGVVSLTKMTADLLPEISLPYMMVITTYVGASPEKVEADITIPIESALGTVSGVKSVSSSSSENFSLVQLEFEDDTDMDSALVKVFSALDPVEATLPDDAGTPEIMEISMDMVATAYVGFQYDGKDIYDLTTFVEDEVIPEIERVDGVASVTKIGLVEKTIHVELDEEKVDALNNKILAKADKKFAEALEDINDAKQKLIDSQKDIDDGWQDIADARADMPDNWKSYYDGVEKLERSKKDLEDNKRDLEDGIDELESAQNQMSQLSDKTMIIQGLDGAAKLNAAINGVNAVLQAYPTATVGELAVAAPDLYAGLSAFPDPTPLAMVSSALDSQREANAGNINMCIQAYNGLREASGLDAKNYTYKTITAADVTEADNSWGALYATAATKLSGGLSQLEAAKAQLDSADDQIKSGEDSLDKAKDQLEDAEDQFDDAEKKLRDGQKQIDDGWETYNDSLKKFYETRETTLKSANADQLLSLATLAQLIYAQNFEMPAGYIDDENDNSWLLKVGQNFETVEELNDVVLCHIDDIGDVKISDVAEVSVIDNAGETYATIDGQSGILLAVYKSSTASTKEVGDAVVEEAAKLGEEFQGLHSVSFFNQGDYISLITSSILESMILGAVLAVIILAIFLKDVMPTLVVAISMPLSMLLAIVALYFSGITLNIMSLAGLALGVGMLVDNSIVVIENIYRLKTLGMSAHQAAVTGAKQVAAPIISSTLTTICVFLPMIFTTGLVKELLIPMAASVVYCLVGSLLIALSVVPAAGSTLLRNSKEKEHRFFDRVMEKYGKSLNWCLNHKVIPLVVTIALLAGSVYSIIRMGVVIIPSMYSEPLAVTIIVDEDKTREEAYAIADQAVAAVSQIDGVETASAMASESMLAMFTSSASGNTDAYNSFICYVLLDGDNPKEEFVKRIVSDMEEALEPLDCETSISANEMDLSLLTGAGLSIYVSGNDLDRVEAATEDIMKIVEQVDGYTDISNGMEDGDDVVHIMIDKNKAMSYGLSVAQVYMELATKLSDKVTATTVNIDGVEMDLEIQDSTHPLTKENIMDYEFDVSSMNSDGNQVIKTYRLSQFAELSEEKTLSTIARSNNSRYMTVSANVEEGYNATLLARELQPLIDKYDAPTGVHVTFSGESETVNDMVVQMSKLIALGFLFIYLVMVAQFQSLLSPFIVLFTIPLAFTGGMAGLLLKGEQLSIMSLMGFTILMGTVVNNGIVFVDYVNQLRIEGKERRDALIETGKARMRPILMTALTTILAMSKLLFGSDIGSQMGGGMAVVIMGGLTYATFMTLYIVPVIYDIFFKKQPLNIQVE